MQNGQPRRNGQIPRKIQPYKTELGRNRSHELAKYKQWNKNCDKKSPKYKSPGPDGFTAEFSHLEKSKCIFF